MLPNGSFSNSKPIYNLHKSVFFKPLWGSELQMKLNVFSYYFSVTLIFFTHANAQFNLFAASTVRSKFLVQNCWSNCPIKQEEKGEPAKHFCKFRFFGRKSLWNSRKMTKLRSSDQNFWTHCNGLKKCIKRVETGLKTAQNHAYRGKFFQDNFYRLYPSENKNRYATRFFFSICFFFSNEIKSLVFFILICFSVVLWLKMTLECFWKPKSL